MSETQDAADPARYWTERIPRQFNRALEAQAALGEAGRREYEAMCAVDATIRVDVAGEGGGRFFLNIAGGRMSAGDRPEHPPFLTLLQDRRAFEGLAREAGDSALALLGGLSGLVGDMKLTRAVVEGLRDVDGLVHFEVTGEAGFAMRTHFGSAPLPAEPKATITVGEVAFRELRSGALDAQTAFMSQQIRVEGDMGAVLQLALAALAGEPSSP